MRFSPCLLALLGVLPVACAASVYDPPEWITAPPVDSGYLYGIGSYVGSLHPEDNLSHAIEQARAMLSRNLSSRVRNETIVRDTENSSSMQSETTVNADFVLKNSEFLQSWVDYQGHTGKPGTVWVLMRILKTQ